MRKPIEEPKGKRVGVWIRVSTEDQAQGESPEHHERRALAYAESRDWNVVEVYRLEAVSGKSVMKRPETQRMLEHVRTGHIQALIFSKLARLARNTKELLDFSDVFRSHDADLVSLHESIDTSSPAGRLFYTMIAGMAQWEREEIADRVAANVPIRAKMGKSLGGPPPFGYQWKDGELVPDPTEAPVRQRIHELFLELRRKGAVAKALNDGGYRTRSGGPWTTPTLHSLLTDPVSKGLRRMNYIRHDRQSGEDTLKLKPEEDWVHVPVEAIVEPDVWDRCFAILEEQKQPRKRPAKRAAHLFSGLAICDCGAKMYVPSNSPKYTCQKCRTKIPTDDLEAIYVEQLKSFFVSPTEIAEYLTEADRVLQEKKALLAVLVSEQGSVKKEAEQLYRLYLDGEIPSKGFGAKYRPLEERLSQLEDEVPRLEAEIDFLTINYHSSDEVLQGGRTLADRWPDLSFTEQRQIVETLTEEIRVSPNEITINLYYLPSIEDMAKSSTPLPG